MKIAEPEQRLKTAWGRIDRQHNALIAARLAGNRILDVGCGYGSLVNYLSTCGFRAEGIDFDPVSIEAARRIFPAAPVHLENAESLNRYPDASFDSIVLKDALHHLVCEGDFRVASQTFRRLLVPGGRLVVLDPNPMWILRVARRIAAHDDVSVDPQRALSVLSDNGFEVRGIAYYEVLGLPLSGGYVGVRLVPNWAPAIACVAGLNQFASLAANALKLGPQVCWRYVIHADFGHRCRRIPGIAFVRCVPGTGLGGGRSRRFLARRKTQSHHRGREWTVSLRRGRRPRRDRPGACR